MLKTARMFFKLFSIKSSSNLFFQFLNSVSIKLVDKDAMKCFFTDNPVTDISVKVFVNWDTYNVILIENSTLDNGKFQIS